MTALLDVSAGKIVLRNTSGQKVFDSDERLFQVTDFVSSSVTLGGWEASFNPSGPVIIGVDTDTNHSIGSVNAHADTVVGSFSAASDNPKGVVGLGWFCAGGSYVHFHEFPSAGSGGVAVFTFRCVSGTLYLHERVLLHANTGIGQPANNIILPPVTFTYKLFCGSFV